MRALVPGLLAFGVLLGAQLAIWRIWRPVGQYASLVILSLAVLIASLGSAYLLPPVIGGSTRFLPVTALDYLNFVMLYSSLVLSYLASYPPIQADSPSMSVLLRIDGAGPKGLTLDEMVAQLNDRVLIAPRLDDLVSSHLATVHHGRYVVGWRGALVAKTYIGFRALLKMEKGG